MWRSEHQSLIDLPSAFSGSASVYGSYRCWTVSGYGNKNVRADFSVKITLLLPVILITPTISGRAEGARLRRPLALKSKNGRNMSNVKNRKK